MIINTGGRTDTVNYYSDWLLNRFEQGEVYVRNPLFPHRVYRYRLSPDTVDCVVFCSKNYRPILSRLHRISDRFDVFCYYTITAYGRDVEPGVPDIDRSIETLEELSRSVGRNRVVWRYDPVLLTEKYTVARHLECFESMAARIAPHVSFALFSFVEMYRRLETNMPEIIPLTPADRDLLARGLGERARRHGLRLQTCGTDESYAAYGIGRSGCLTAPILEQALGRTFRKLPHKGTRKGCSCMPSRDIGAYDTCLNGCKYCYANRRPDSALENYRRHDPRSPLLVGGLQPSDTLCNGVQERWTVEGEPSLF